jgi:hypothetical protein
MAAQLAFKTQSAKSEGDPIRDSVAWTWLRLFLGSLQMPLAVLAFAALLLRSLHSITIFLAIAATATTLLSRLLFRRWRRPESGGLVEGR